MTPFQALCGYEPPKSNELAINDIKVPTIKDQLKENQNFFQKLKENLNIAKNHMKQQVDQQRSKKEFSEGDWVYDKLQPYKQLSLKQGGENKLDAKFYDHFKSSRKLVKSHP